MSISSTLSTTATTSSSSSTDAYSGMSSGDFIKIMLTELTQQDPFEPSKVSDMVTNIREIQSLLSAQEEDQRSDLSWGNELVGKTVTVGQTLLSESEYSGLVDDGLNPDVGSGTVTGTVTGFKVIDNQVWVGVGGLDYKIDNVQSMTPSTTNADTSTLAEICGSFIGRTAGYVDAAGTAQSGVISSIKIGDDGSYTLVIGDDEVAFSSLTSVS